MEMLQTTVYNLIVEALLPSQEHLLMMSQLNLYWLHVQSVPGRARRFMGKKPAIQGHPEFLLITLYTINYRAIALSHVRHLP